MNEELELSKRVLISNDKKFVVDEIEFYKFIDECPLCKVHFRNFKVNAIVRADIFYTKDDVYKEEIKFVLAGIPFKECWNYDIPPNFFQLKRLKNNAF